MLRLGRAACPDGRSSLKNGCMPPQLANKLDSLVEQMERPPLPVLVQVRLTRLPEKGTPSN